MCLNFCWSGTNLLINKIDLNPVGGNDELQHRLCDGWARKQIRHQNRAWMIDRRRGLHDLIKIQFRWRLKTICHSLFHFRYLRRDFSLLGPLEMEQGLENGLFGTRAFGSKWIFGHLDHLGTLAHLGTSGILGLRALLSLWGTLIFRRIRLLSLRCKIISHDSQFP